MRIASLVPSATEMLFALGAGADVVAVTHECDYPPPARGLPHVTATVLPEGLSAGEIDAAVKEVVGEGRALYSLDEARLAELEPDLIVTQAVCEVCAVSFDDVVEVAARLPSRPRVLQQDPSTLAEVLEDVSRLGEAIGIEERAAELRAALEGRLAAVRTAVAGAEPPRVLALEWLDPPFVGGHWIPEMIGLAGGVDAAGPAGAESPNADAIALPGAKSPMQNVLVSPGAKSPEVEWERLAGLDPDLVVVMPCGWYVEDSLAQAREHRQRIESLGAERVFAVDAASTYSRPGPRLVDGTELLAHLCHPDRVAAPAGIEFAAVGR